jgi:LPS O-antigen subunit length determinant protein (WzzB/FepE family)
VQPFSSRELTAYLWKMKWYVIVSTFVVALITYSLTYLMPIYYMSSVTCVPPKQDQGSLGGALGGISASMKDFGLSKLAGKSNSDYEFIVILFAKSIRDSLIKEFRLVDEYEMHEAKYSDLLSVVEGNLDIQYRPEGQYIISVWSKDAKKAQRMATRFVELANELSNSLVRQEADLATAYLEKRLASVEVKLASIQDSLEILNKSYLVFSPEVQAQASAGVLAESQSAVLREEVLLGLLEENFGKTDPQTIAQQNLVQRLKSQLESIKNTPGTVGDLSIRGGAGVGATAMRLLAELEAMTKIKVMMYPTLEQVRMDKYRTAPTLLILDKAEVPEKKDRPARTVITASYSVGFFFLAVFALFVRFAVSLGNRNPALS